MNVTWIRWYVLLNVKILIIARPPSSTNLSSLLSSPLLLSRGSWSNIGLYRTDEKECSILTRTTLISLSLVIDNIRSSTRNANNFVASRDDLHPFPRDNSTQDGNSILDSTSPSFLHDIFRLVTRFCDGTWNDIIGIGAGWATDGLFTIRELLGCETLDVGGGGCRVLRKKMEIIFEGEMWKRGSISSYPTRWNRGQPSIHIDVSWHLTLTRV